MEPVNPLGPEARACLQAYRREMPAAAAVARDWSRIRAAIDDRDDVDDIDDIDDASDELHAVAIDPRASVGRWALATGLAFAIAAAVLLLLRGVIDATTALGEGAPTPMEAVDHAEDDGSERTLQSRRASAQSRVATQASPPNSPQPASGVGTPQTRVPSASPAAATPSSPALALPDSGNASPDPNAARLAEETRLLRAAREALAADDPEAALRSLADHERRFPDGALLEERMLYRAIARCRGGESEAADAFLRRFPKSPHAPRVRSECGESP